jgi:23S rRNA (cytosine1962-C5)-methyltransferase
MVKVILQKGRERSLIRRHPWVFSGAVERVEGNPKNGETVSIYAAGGDFLALGAFSSSSQIRVRVWSFKENEEIGEAFFRGRLEQAIDYRRRLKGVEGCDACRLVNAESDGFPGLVVDRYADFLVCQFLSAGVEYHKHGLVRLLMELLKPVGIFERSDADVRVKEGLEPVKGLLEGTAPPEWIEVHEKECRFHVDIVNGHKTGFYLDQRDNRLLLGQCARDREVLNTFSYTGGFGIHALKAGAAKVTNLDSSEACLDLCVHHARLNDLEADRMEILAGDAFVELRKLRDEGRSFDLVVLDPPKFALSASQVEKAARAYKDINLLAIKLLKPDGVLFTFSCSGHVDMPLFRKIVADASLDAGREMKVLHLLSQATDHPVNLSFPEGAYLKGLVCLAG